MNTRKMSNFTLFAWLELPANVDRILYALINWNGEALLLCITQIENEHRPWKIYWKRGKQLIATKILQTGVFVTVSGASALSHYWPDLNWSIQLAAGDHDKIMTKLKARNWEPLVEPPVTIYVNGNYYGEKKLVPGLHKFFRTFSWKYIKNWHSFPN